MPGVSEEIQRQLQVGSFGVQRNFRIWVKVLGQMFLPFTFEMCKKITHCLHLVEEKRKATLVNASISEHDLCNSRSKILQLDNTFSFFDFRLRTKEM